jgi:hypothetical protein
MVHPPRSFGFRRLARRVAPGAAHLSLLGATIVVACSGGSKTRGDGPGGGTETTGAGGTGISFGEDGGLIGSGGSGMATMACDAASACPQDQICVKTQKGGICEPKGSPCMTNNDCKDDTFCCSGSCRVDGAAAGVCVPFGDQKPVDESCKGDVAIGVFSPSLQCEWKGPAATDTLPSHKRVLTSPLIADLPNDSGAAAEIIVVSSDSASGAIMGDGTGGVIRILNGQTCALEETIDVGPRVRDAATPAIADLDGDGKMEIVARTNGFETNNKIVAYKWNGKKFDLMWTSSPDGVANPIGGNGNWDGVSLHDLDDDGLPEVIGRNGEVYSGKDGHRISAGGGGIILNSDPVVGDVDHDGKVELIANKVYRWNGSGWTEAYPGVGATTYDTAPQFFAYADFGTPNGASFDRTKLDGIAEIVSVGAGTISIHTLAGQEIMHVTRGGGGSEGQRGGPPTIGDFDGDGFPEVATALATEFGVFDLDCESATTPGCTDKWVKWVQASQDASSARTGSTIFDFEGDGKAEAIYADECFLRIYEGKTGGVLFSAFRSSCTWWEQPIVGDPDKDGRTEIVVNSNPNCYVQCPTGKSGPYIDPIHPGVRCLANSDCVSNVCNEGFCRCTTDLECGNNFMDDPVHPRNKGGLVCTAPLAGTAGTGNVCRMQHPNPDGAQREEDLNGIKVYRDQHDRWASSRPLWNQHAYNITNINDDGTVPKTSQWKPNYLQKGLNNFRQNVQGAASANELADITGVMDKTNVCQQTMGGLEVHANVCNRGLRGVGADMPATFYLGDVASNDILCQTQTSGPVPVGGCLPISCKVIKAIPNGSSITMVVNDAGSGMRVTDECHYENNTSTVVIDACEIVK